MTKNLTNRNISVFYPFTCFLILSTSGKYHGFRLVNFSLFSFVNDRFNLGFIYGKTNKTKSKKTMTRYKFYTEYKNDLHFSSGRDRKI